MGLCDINVLSLTAHKRRPSSTRSTASGETKKIYKLSSPIWFYIYLTLFRLRAQVCPLSDSIPIHIKSKLYVDGIVCARYYVGREYYVKYLISAMCAMLFSCSTPTTKNITNQMQGARGTGFNVGYKGVIYGVTAGHVCRKSRSGVLTAREGNRLVQYKIVKIDNTADLCVTEPFSGVPSLSLYLGEAPPTSLTLYGYPQGGENVEIVSNGVFTGVDSALDYTLSNDDDSCDPNSLVRRLSPRGDVTCLTFKIRATTDAIAYPGNSGGPAMTENGFVAGVVSAIGSGNGRPTYLVPSPLVAQFLDQVAASK